MNMHDLKPLNRIEIADIIATAFPATRPARSQAYRLGVEKALESASAGGVLPEMYEGGTVAYDAYHAGVVEGRALWARHIATKAALPHRPLAPANVPDLLAAELIHSGEVITTLLNHITAVQLADVRHKLQQAGLIGKSNVVGRGPERHGVLVATGFAIGQQA